MMYRPLGLFQGVYYFNGCSFLISNRFGYSLFYRPRFLLGFFKLSNMNQQVTVPFLNLFGDQMWIEVKDGHVAGRELFNRHYSKYNYKDGRKPKLYVGPGEKMVLITPDGSAVFVWRKFISGDGQHGINGAIFRNESSIKSSALILKAEEHAWKRWPGERLYTYINQHKIRSTNPGCCYKKAGWRQCGITKVNKHLIFEKLPV
jgi:hypothetical protein